MKLIYFKDGEYRIELGTEATKGAPFSVQEGAPFIYFDKLGLVVPYGQWKDTAAEYVHWMKRSDVNFL